MDDYLRGLSISERLTVAMMVNRSDLFTEIGCVAALVTLFPESAQTSPDTLFVYCPEGLCPLQTVEPLFAVCGLLLPSVILKGAVDRSAAVPPQG
jgi:hypothetical protein